MDAGQTDFRNSGLLFLLKPTSQGEYIILYIYMYICNQTLGAGALVMAPMPEPGDLERFRLALEMLRKIISFQSRI